MSAIILSPKKMTRLLFTEQLKWTIWVLSFMFVIYIGFLFFSGDSIASFIDMAHFSNGSVAVYLFVLGILTTSSFFRYYINLGATRKNFYFGVVTASILLAVSTIIIITFLSFIIHFIIGTPSIVTPANIRGESFPASISAFLHFFTSSILVYIIYFLTGWLIGLTFYRAGWLYGMLSIAGAVTIAWLVGILWETAHISFFSLVTDLPIFLSILISILLIGFLSILNFRLIKDVRIKM